MPSNYYYNYVSNYVGDSTATTTAATSRVTKKYSRAPIKPRVAFLEDVLQEINLDNEELLRTTPMLIKDYTPAVDSEPFFEKPPTRKSIHKHQKIMDTIVKDINDYTKNIEIVTCKKSSVIDKLSDGMWQETHNKRIYRALTEVCEDGVVVFYNKFVKPSPIGVLFGVIEHIPTYMGRLLFLKQCSVANRRLYVITLSNNGINELNNKYGLIPCNDGYKGKNIEFIKGYTEKELNTMFSLIGATKIEVMNAPDEDNLIIICVSF